MALHVAHYNFCWMMREKGTSGKLRATQAMQAGIANTLWTFEELFERVHEHQRQQTTAAKYRRFLDRLN